MTILNLIKDTAVKQSHLRSINISQGNFDKMQELCKKLKSTHKAFADLAISNLISQHYMEENHESNT